LKTKRITVEEVCVHTVVTVEHDIPLVQCAKIMHDDQVGSLVMTEMRDGVRTPVGILTDRDITVKVVAFSLDPHVFTARDIMARPLVTALPDEDLMAALARMRNHGVLRVPVVSDDGALVGILAADDIWQTLVEEVDALERIILAKKPKMVLTRPSTRKVINVGQVELK
jgi:predicted transcriptional regulator